jgi:hypothetical protein
MANLSDSEKATQQRRETAIKAATDLVGRKSADSGVQLTALGEVTVEVAQIFERYILDGQ